MAIPIKKEKTKVERLIKTVWRKTDKGKAIKKPEEKNLIFAITGVLFLLEIYDRMNGTGHKDFFIKRYLSLHNGMTQIEISSKFGVCKDTIGDYCVMYIQVFGECLDVVEIINKKLDNSSGNPLETVIKILLLDL